MGIQFRRIRRYCNAPYRDGKRKILFDSSREGANVDSFFQELLNGAYDSKTEVDTDDSTTGESAEA